MEKIAFIGKDTLACVIADDQRRYANGKIARRVTQPNMTPHAAEKVMTDDQGGTMMPRAITACHSRTIEQGKGE
ncbi:hypothetical protein PXK30_06885 [Phaeobacter gallaeciensis]|jgi:pyrroline-5-carboxylate reductase|uniref:hypothetical protein n=1 Tax=Phaeobacter gallaeciensis TaxID=60890 RepID=UPI00237F49B0|nr:hypothetical protein [Phaeobacter gallaeciensis]MDE4302970.1 hypothetical protein [Phaeobacter gallaeciensis]MDE4307362.1 hypothetical protein [Phaeobacter gallaeciensis]MDE4311820.1 hypothetical protein [Phaeobacter gallaeciensis]MDE4316675.1 hypothetical protein [Phaeobacter gallaeciensis]MDE4320754.1 hypothetical protein [Phaeobacter gallaeciensis]